MKLKEIRNKFIFKIKKIWIHLQAPLILKDSHFQPLLNSLLLRYNISMKKCSNRALKSLFFFCFVFSKYLKNGLNYLLFALIFIFVKKTWNVKKCCGLSNLGLVHIKAPASVLHDGAKETWRVPVFMYKKETKYL